MWKTCDIYLNDNNFYDFRMISTIGFSYDDVDYSVVEEGEDFNTALLREMKEEIGVDVISYSDEVKYSIEDRDNHYYYEIYEISGEIGTGCGPEFTDESYKDHGKYLIEMIDIKDIVEGKIEIVPKEIREQIIENYKR